MNSLYGVYAIILHFQLFQVRCEYFKQRIVAINLPTLSTAAHSAASGLPYPNYTQEQAKKGKNPPTLGSKQQVTQCLMRATLSFLPELSLHLIENI